MTTSEERALLADDKAQELGPNDARPPFRTAPGYVRGTHPDTGLDVTFTPGETLPAWASAALPNASVDKLGVLVLPDSDVMPPASPEKRTPPRRR